MEFKISVPYSQERPRNSYHELYTHSTAVYSLSVGYTLIFSPKPRLGLPSCLCLLCFFTYFFSLLLLTHAPTNYFRPWFVCHDNICCETPHCTIFCL